MGIQEPGDRHAFTNPGISDFPGGGSCLGGAVLLAALVLNVTHCIPLFTVKKSGFLYHSGEGKVKMNEVI